MTTNDGDKVEIMSEATTLLCTGQIQPDQAAFPWLDFASQGFSTLLGALLAFLFGLVLYQKQKTHENMSYLQYAVSVLCQLTSHLYVFKEDVQKRYDEALQQRRNFETAAVTRENVHIQMRETGNYMYGAEFQLALDLEKLAFLVKRDPNLIILLGTLMDSVKSLNHIAADINQEIVKYSSQETAVNPMLLLLSLRKNKLLYEQLDSTLYLTEKAAGLLVQFGKLEYARRMKIKSFQLTDEKYKVLKPKPIKSWEDDYKWFPKKKRWWNK
ncbi:MAG: hypothetical protein ACKOC1_07775 [Hyphomicrobiales bacterium]